MRVTFLATFAFSAMLLAGGVQAQSLGPAGSSVAPVSPLMEAIMAADGCANGVCAVSNMDTALPAGGAPMVKTGQVWEGDRLVREAVTPTRQLSAQDEDIDADPAARVARPGRGMMMRMQEQ